MGKGLNVLSLFDGISCGRVALERAGVEVEGYFASEIDARAMEVSKNNWPDIVQLGSVEGWKDWELPKIDLLIGGSPCQGFSWAGVGRGFEDERSGLFYAFVDVKNAVGARWVLLENVRMKKEWVARISELMGLREVLINSAVVSAQNRERLYWTDIEFGGVDGIVDRGLVLRDIVDVRISDVEKRGWWNRYVPYENSGRGLCRKVGDVPSQMFQVNSSIYSIEGKCPTLLVKGALKKISIGDDHYRFLTMLEYERLQTLPEGYTEGVAGRVTMIGNCWTVDVIAHIFGGLRSDVV